MPYILVEGSFQISSETWTFKTWIPTEIEKTEDLHLDEIYKRNNDHVNIYWRDGFSSLLTNDAYSYNIQKVNLVKDSPESLNRVQAYTEYSVSGANRQSQHKVGYTKKVISNIQSDNWFGEFDSKKE